MGAVAGNTPQRSQLLGRGEAMARAGSLVLGAAGWVLSVSRFLAAIFQVLEQASLQAEHRGELKPGIKCRL